MALTRAALHSVARRRSFRILSSASAVLALVAGLVVNAPLRAHAGSGYSNAVLADSPTFYYGLDETSGTTATDGSGAGHSGTYTGSVTLGVAGATGQGDTAVSLASGAFVNSNYIPPSAPAVFTLEAWVDIPATIPAGTHPTILGYSNTSSTHQGFDWYLNSDASSNVQVATTANSGFVSNTVPAISLNAWHYMVVTYDGSNVCAYVDGQQQLCQALTGTLVLDPGNTIEAGATPGPGGTATGGIELDDVAYYTTALSPARVLAHYEAARTPSVSGVSPSSGSLAGGDAVTITGSGFTGATAVDFGSAAASFTVTNDTTISASSPSSAALGGVDVTVTTPGGQSATSSADRFTYTQAATTTALPGSSANPSTYTQPVTFTTTVSTGGGGTPTGTVTWKDGGATLGSSTLDGTGATAYTTSALATGTHLISAVYGGDTNHLGSTSSALSQGVGVAASSVGTPAPSLNPSVYGQSVTFTATVSGPGATPTGSVTWSDGATVLGTSTLASGSTTFAITTLSAGTHSITAQYGGDANYGGSASAALTQTVDVASTSTSVLPAPNPATAGQTVTFSASVSGVAPGAGTPTGTVTFYDGAVSIGTGTLGAGGTATMTLAETGGTHDITAQYAGDANFTGSTSSNVVLTVDQAPSTVSAVGSSLNPSTYGSPVVFTVTVTGGPTPTGTVTFYDGATSIGTATLDASATATLSTSQLTAGSHTISAVYGGDVNNAGATSPALTQLVGQATPAVATPASSADPSTYGGTVTFSTTLTGAGATPTGTVTWMDGAVVLGTSSVGPTGTATFATAALGAGPHSIAAAYGGDLDYTAATSAVLVQTVNQAATSVSTPTSTVNPSIVGQAVTFSVSLTPADATGTVTWTDGGATLGTSAVGVTGVASFSTASLTVGAHSITASYGGDQNHLAAASAALAQSVNRVMSAVSTPVSSSNPSVVGQTVTFSVSVTPAGAGGTVTWDQDGSTVATTSVDAGGGSSFTTSTLAVGAHDISAVYGGDANDTSAASGILVQSVSKITTAISTPVSSANPASAGESVTFTASVTPPGATGTVTWSDGGAALGSSTLDAGGAASLTTTALTVGAHSISATYGGDGTHLAAASAALAQTVIRITGAISTPVSSSNPSIVGRPVTFSATVTPPGATGTVTWLDGTATLGTTGVGAGGAASLSTAALALGSHGISAVYSGDATHLPATSGVLVQLVERAVATISTPASSLNPSPAGQSVTFSVTVGPAAATGSVTWSDGGTVLGTTGLASGSASYTTASLSVGSHSITAVYSGDATFLGAASAALVQVVDALPIPTPTPTPGPTPTPAPTPGGGAPVATPPSSPPPSPAPGPSPTPSSGGGHPAGSPPKSGPPPDSGTKAAATAEPWWLKIASDIGVKSAFPLLLIILALLFLAIQDRIDRKDPKLALAPARPDPKLVFPSP